MNLKRSLPDGLRQQGLRIVGSIAAAVGWAVLTVGPGAVLADDQIKLGRELFEHKWVKNDPLCPDGDGLGPMYNAESCAACHSLGGMGGAGSAEHNVSLISVVANMNAAVRERVGVRSHAAKVHPAFAAGPNAPAS